MVKEKRGVKVKELKKNYQIIETTAQLDKMTSYLSDEEAIAVDLEADSMFRFRERVCLLQIKTSRGVFLIDPLKIKALDPLKPVFANPGVKKVFHGADFDVRSLFRDFGIEISNLFDTEIASRFAGIKHSGLDSVLKKFFNLDIDKKFQKKNWSTRPVSEEMLKYAASDVAYLFPLAESLENDLKNKGRLEWVKEECSILSRVRPQLPGADTPLFLKVRGAGKLKRRELAVLEALLKYRVKEASKKDRPLFKIISNRALLEIAKAMPVSDKAIDALGALSRKQKEMYAPGLSMAVKKAMKIPDKKLPVYPRERSRRVNSAASYKIKAMKELRDNLSELLNIDPAIILTKSQITSIAVENPYSVEALGLVKDIRKWQTKEFGKAIVNICKAKRA